ncbi:nicotinate-nucleotide adenylyltransferase [Echinimonas agarilytica]|uniref:Probable nicotinate-nucleotide adenylyltransferase n=1 Tax=Echinimonas agarilytica TaxID=1215918 RepID=A0AA41W5E9_9GAMM|nr:nicotinate-nucleotide adenylyltransferase [Echinimonas agarilytica]MCM2679086.1 nicotinate-nucleotide adenylyltransferase [Echinimonas agarilytica]
MTERIGFLGGTFDPIHRGHIEIAHFVHNQLNLNQLQLIPNHQPPHKNSTAVTAEHRLEMARIAAAPFTELSVNDIELNQNSPSYSVNTLRKLRKRHPDAALFFIMGMDSFANLSSWYRWDQLLHLCHLVVCRRPGDSVKANSLEEQLLKQYQSSAVAAENFGHIICLENPHWQISSTEIRTSLACQNENIPQLDPAVEDYIRAHQLYCPVR